MFPELACYTQHMSTDLLSNITATLGHTSKSPNVYTANSQIYFPGNAVAG